MTPKEKAKNLVDKLYYTISNNGSYSGENSIPRRWQEAKQCALIAVDEILNQLNINIDGWDIKYWIKVKQEIEKL